MTVLKFVLSVMSILFTLCVDKVCSQDEDFKMVPDSEIMEIYMVSNGSGFGITIMNLPNEILGCDLAIDNLKGTFHAGTTIVSRQFFLESTGSYSRSDTFVVYLISPEGELLYPAEIFKLSYSNGSQAKLGANLYILNCVPDNDPWMPTSYSPFLFPKNGYYINHENGKIKKGSRLINSGYYSICELEDWKYISPYGIYLDNNRNQFRGSELIAKGKIELANWHLETFDLYWFR